MCLQVACERQTASSRFCEVFSFSYFFLQSEAREESERLLAIDLLTSVVKTVVQLNVQPIPIEVFQMRAVLVASTPTWHCIRMWRFVANR